jgi:hypothetical protein
MLGSRCTHSEGGPAHDALVVTLPVPTLLDDPLPVPPLLEDPLPVLLLEDPLPVPLLDDPLLAAAP